MRLTLRTLLAYLDDVLEPSETKLIGQKIQESAVAGKLISLIRLVVRQRRLKAPSVSGPNIGIDPNVVAQYLDNTLPAEQVVEVEKVLLTSDELLAEVASCHQVLALVMGKPVEVSAASRERLYALGPVATSEQLRVDEPPSTDSALVAAAARDAERVNGAPRPQAQKPPEVPEYLRQSSWGQRVVPTAVVALLVIVCAGLLYLDPSLLPALRQVKRERDADKLAQSTSTDSVPAVVAKSAAGSNPSTQLSTLDLNLNGDQMPQPASVPPAPTIDPPPPPDATEGATVGTKVKPSTPVIASNGADAPADASAAPKGPAAAGSPTPNPPPVGNDQPTAVKSPMVVQYISGEGIALRLDEQKQHWFMLPRRSAVAPGEAIAVPEPFEAQLDFDRGAILATVVGGSNMRILNPNRVTASGLGFQRGQVLLRSAHKELPPNCALTISVGGDSWVLEFLSPDTACTIDISPREPVQFEKSFDLNWYLGVLRVTSGSVKWTSADGQVQQVAAQYALEIAPQQSTPGVKSSPISSPFNPDWTDSQKRRLSPLRQKSPMFERQIELDQPVELTLQSLIKDPHAKVSELAIRTLGLIEAYPELVQALAECEYEEGRFAARDGIRAWLGRNAERGPLLKGALDMHFPIPADADAAYHLLWGFRPEDGSNGPISFYLVACLRSTHVAVRELAFFWIAHLSNRKWEFRAVDVQGRREVAARKIEIHVNKDGALVKPAAKDLPSLKSE